MDMVRPHRRVRTLETYPHADISIKKNRVRKHSGGNTIYMENGTEFEIELDNNTDETWLAKIKLNGKYISSSGIVLRPGEHDFIERFLDDDKKFLFDTYDVHKSRKNAIANNGKVEVEFYREKRINMHQLHWVWQGSSKPNIWPDYPTDPNYTLREFFTTCKNLGTGSSPLKFGNLTSNLTPKGMSGESSRGSVQCSLGNASPMLSAGNLMETGRVEKGSHSEQQFTSVDMDFENYCSHRVDYQILPLSRKAFVQNKDVRQYCADCGRRRKKAENFCPTCGSKF